MKHICRFAFTFLALVCVAGAQGRTRARDLGIAPGVFTTGPENAITDVDGVRVGHTTVIEGDRVRTGVTAVLPHGGNLFQDKVAGAVFVGNAFGKLAGSTQVTELGTIETPIVLTNTLSVGTAMDAVVRYTLSQPGNEQVQSVNAIIGETNDGGLNDIRGLHVTTAHVLEAIRRAATGAVAEGAVGAGTGTICYGWKGGIGTSSRRVRVGERTAAERGTRGPAQQAPGAGAPRVNNARGAGADGVNSDGTTFTVGVLAQTNFGGNLTIAGVPVYRFLQPPRAVRGAGAPGVDKARGAGADGVDKARGAGADGVNNDGSCMLVVATDAPLDARDLRRLAARAVFGLGRTGSAYSNGSGDFAIAFSTSPEMRSRFNDNTARTRRVLPPDAASPLFEAALEATEEAVYNSLLQATSVRSSIGAAEAIPIDRLRELLKK
ncbi:MAG TPA: P1 family peptidase [Vicinamibacterales bacterium]|nr:P1 family peptidase [Vicinamibacterales bacterium]